MFISSLHNIKSNFLKKVKRTLKKDERNLLYFDAFGQWSEHDRSKMEWKMKIGIEWRPSMASRPKIGDRPATFSLLSPPLSHSLDQPPHLWDNV
jgi:hypothetical protein